MTTMHLDIADNSGEIVSKSLDLDVMRSAKFIHVNHGDISRNNDNILQLATNHSNIRDLVFELAGEGFHLFKSEGGRSSFVQAEHISSFWHRVKEGEFSLSDTGLIYTIAKNSTQPKSMVVIFSSMADVYNKSSLMRYFEQNFRSIAKFIPEETLILRIADIGGVVGGFYMPTKFDPMAADNIANLITEISTNFDIPAKRVVLYGASKGGTGALYHALNSGYHCISVDPVVTDDYYETHYKDSHWTSGDLFLERKVDAFSRAAKEFAQNTDHFQNRICVVSSPGSPLFGSISEFVSTLPEERLNYLVSHDKKITSHPDVSRHTLKLVTGLINVHLEGLSLNRENYNF